MILADTSVWVDHLRSGDATLTALLDGERVLCHPHVIGEPALGGLSRRSSTLADLLALPQAVLATDVEVLRLIEANALSGKGVG